MIYDCFVFFNELDILELRFNELDKVVDKFVLVEATKTFSNKDKPLYFQENRSRYTPFLHKIIHVVIDHYPPFINAWTYETFQRNGIKKGLISCEDSDLILISDADEIPRAEALLPLVNLTKIVCLDQLMFYYHLNRFCVSAPFWTGTKVLPYRLLNSHTPDEIRSLKTEVIPNGGWHFSFMGGIENIILKTESYSHQEFNTDTLKNPDALCVKIDSGKNIFGYKHRTKLVEIDEHFPLYLVENKSRFAHLLKDSNPLKIFSISSLIKKYRCISLLKKWMYYAEIKSFLLYISLYRYSRKALLKRILPKSLHGLVDKVHIRLPDERSKYRDA